MTPVLWIVHAGHALIVREGGGRPRRLDAKLAVRLSTPEGALLIERLGDSEPVLLHVQRPGGDTESSVLVRISAGFVAAPSARWAGRTLSH